MRQERDRGLERERYLLSLENESKQRARDREIAARKKEAMVEKMVQMRKDREKEMAIKLAKRRDEWAQQLRYEKEEARSRKTQKQVELAAKKERELLVRKTMLEKERKQWKVEIQQRETARRAEVSELRKLATISRQKKVEAVEYSMRKKRLSVARGKAEQLQKEKLTRKRRGQNELMLKETIKEEQTSTKKRREEAEIARLEAMDSQREARKKESSRLAQVTCERRQHALEYVRHNRDAQFRDRQERRERLDYFNSTLFRGRPASAPATR
eukprot:TRINITY_DN5956_c1_g1_i1.p1 TRINITY_DN5956_c1_g1~~TRINITY_DN5956_c1_g1_i1.p1  ORF type:complete len:271 (+),score=62.20 TRINITY_DN5956_c1_g1_i1:299-1111(+)